MKNYCLQAQAYSKVCLGFIFAFIQTNSKAQTNLIPNNSFEVYTQCPFLFNAPPPTPWYTNSNYNESYANSCSNEQCLKVPYNCSGGGNSYQYARTGDAYIGLFYFNGNDLRNYCQVKLITSLKAGKRYYAEHYINLADGCIYGCNNIGMLFTKTAKYVDTVNFPYGVLAANPQILNYGNPVIIDTQNWVKVSGIFKATGGEQYLTLGNFKYDSQTTQIQFQPNGYPGSGYNIDDVSVYELDSFCLKANAGKDTTITIGDSIFIGSHTNGIDSLKWLQNGAVIDSIRPGFWVKPTTGTSYILQQTINGCFSADTVTIGVVVPLKFTSFTAQIQPTPSPSKEGNVMLHWQTANEINVSHFNIQRSINGNPASQQGRYFETIGRTLAKNKNVNEYSFTDVLLPSLEGLGAGLFYRIQSIDKDGKISYSEVKQIRLNQLTDNPINIYPNPAKDVVNIKTYNAIQIKIIDCFGRIITKINSPQPHQTINTNQFAKGVYLVQITLNNGNILIQKLVME